MNFYTCLKKQELDILEIGLKYQDLHPMPPGVISSTKRRSKIIRPTVFRKVLGGPIGLMQVMLNWNLLKHRPFDALAPFSSDKIQAKIFDLGYGGARRALHNLSQKSARFLSAAITRTLRVG